MAAEQPDRKNMPQETLKLPADLAGFSFAFDKVALLESAKNELYAFYTPDPDPTVRARGAAVAAVLNAATVELTKLIESRITDLYRTQEIINESRADQENDGLRLSWDEALAVQIWAYFAEARGLIQNEDRWEEIAGEEVGYHEVGRITEVAQAIAQELKPAYTPPDKDVGKFLSRYGIVDADLKKLVAAAKKILPPAAPAAEAKVVLTRPAEEPPALSDVSEAVVVPPTKDELADAIDLWWQGSGPEAKDASIHLEISAQTLKNYVGRKTKPKLNSSQARYLAGDCRDCIEKLTRALVIFERVKSVSGDD